MNSLSWLIYFAGIVTSISNIVTFVATVSAFFTVVMIVGIFIDAGENDGNSFFSVVAKRAIKFSISATILFGFLSAITPDKNIVMMIAASEVGEKVFTSQAVTGIVDPSVELLKTWIEKTTKELKKD